MAEVTQPISDAEILDLAYFYGAGAMKKQGGLIRCPSRETFPRGKELPSRV